MRVFLFFRKYTLNYFGGSNRHYFTIYSQKMTKNNYIYVCIHIPSILATSCEVLTHWKRLWCWEGLGAGGKGDGRGWDGWMASSTQWTWVWVNSGRWWWTGRPGVLRFMGSQRVSHDWATELNWTEGGEVICIKCMCVRMHTHAWVTSSQKVCSF